MMDIVIGLLIGLLVIKLPEEFAEGLHNTHTLNHADDYWMVPAYCLLAIGTFALLF